jgi:hypothetical protein
MTAPFPTGVFCAALTPFDADLLLDHELAAEDEGWKAPILPAACRIALQGCKRLQS